MGEMLQAGGANYSELKNLIVWAKDNGGMGAFYRSRHELIFAFKNGSAPHINSFELGQHGRYRTNVWEYRGVNTLKAGRVEELALHPTVKPVAMIADAIKDVSRRGGIVLDLFGGSGSTLIAAHKTGRRARLCELDPVYCDRILGRWETFAKDDAELIACGLSAKASGAENAWPRRAGEADSALRNTLSVRSRCPTIERSDWSCHAHARITRWGMASRPWPLDLSLDVQAIQRVALEARAINCRLSTKND